jgi:hypothetical protein
MRLSYLVDLDGLKLRRANIRPCASCFALLQVEVGAERIVKTVADAGFLHRFYVRAEHVERGGDVVAIGTERKRRFVLELFLTRLSRACLGKSSSFSAIHREIGGKRRRGNVFHVTCRREAWRWWARCRSRTHAWLSTRFPSRLAPARKRRSLS